MSSKPTRVAVAILLAGVVALAAGCGGGGDKSITLSVNTTTRVPTTNSAGSGAEPAFATAKNCRDMAGLAAKVASSVEAAGNGSKALQAEAAELQALANAAPAAIKSDFQTFSTTFSSFLGALRKSGYKLGSTTPPTTAQAAALAKASRSFDTSKLKQAEQHLNAWARQNCAGVHLGG